MISGCHTSTNWNVGPRPQLISWYKDAMPFKWIIYRLLEQSLRLLTFQHFRILKGHSEPPRPTSQLVSTLPQLVSFAIWPLLWHAFISTSCSRHSFGAQSPSNTKVGLWRFCPRNRTGPWLVIFGALCSCQQYPNGYMRC